MADLIHRHFDRFAAELPYGNPASHFVNSIGHTKLDELLELEGCIYLVRDKRHSSVAADHRTELELHVLAELFCHFRVSQESHYHKIGSVQLGVLAVTK